jgi:hypothetical protein
VRVHHEEGVAIHFGPEPCVRAREGADEASAGERIGQPLSRETSLISGADAFQIAEGDMSGSASASARTARRGRRPWHVRTLLAREPGGLVSDHGRNAPLVRGGKARSRRRRRTGARSQTPP